MKRQSLSMIFIESRYRLSSLCATATKRYEWRLPCSSRRAMGLAGWRNSLDVALDVLVKIFEACVDETDGQLLEDVKAECPVALELRFTEPLINGGFVREGAI